MSRAVPLVKPPKLSSVRENTRLYPRVQVHRDEWAGSTDRGVPFLDQNPAFAALYPNARLLVELGWGANPVATVANWFDISTDVQMTSNGLQAITISPFGRSDATSQTQPAGCTFQVDNRSGKYSRGPQSLNYPNVKLNVPVRVSISLTGALNDFDVVFQGNAWSFRPSWDATGNYAVVNVSASGTLRQLQQGATPVKSPLARVLSNSNPLAYWTLEDATGSTQGASALPSVGPLILGPYGTLPAFGSVNAANGSSPLPNFALSTLGGSLTGTVPATSVTDRWTFQFVLDVGTTMGSGAVWPLWFVLTDGTIWGVQVNMASSRWGLAYGTPTTGVGTIGTTPLFSATVNPFDGLAHIMRVAAKQNGANVDWKLLIDDTVIDSGTQASLTLTRLASVFINQPGIPTPPAPSTMVVGHVAAYASYFETASTHISAMQGYPGENVLTRLNRLSIENNLPIQIVGTSTTAMGPQTIDTLPNLLRECEATDQGVLGDGLGPGLYYIARSSRYNKTTAMILDATQGDIVPPFQPEDDDQKILNKWVVSRKNGSSATFSDDTGPLGTAAIGTYDSSLTVNTQSDVVLSNYAAWLVHLGTVDGYRYSTLTLDFANQIPAKAPAFLAMLPGSRFEVDNVATYAPQHPNEIVDLLAEGWAITLSRFAFTATLNASPAQAWTVDALNQNFRLEMAGQTLTNDLLPGATSITLSTATGHQLFTTTSQYPADFPLQLNVAGWRINVTAASGSSSPQSLTIDASPNTQTIPAGTSVTLWKPASLAL